MTHATDDNDEPTRPTPEQTLQALRDSIAHWEKNASAQQPNDVHLHSESCALCALFEEGGCQECPVAQEAGQPLCRGTPWTRASDAWANWLGTPGKARAQRNFHTAAAREVEFLRGILADLESGASAEPRAPEPAP